MEGSVALAEMLSCNKSLTELNLECCHIPEDGLRDCKRTAPEHISEEAGHQFQQLRDGGVSSTG